VSFIDPIIPDPEWGRPSPSIEDDDVYEDDEDPNDGDYDDHAWDEDEERS
jgi:hypothetical protein